jgi:hypothetical protein
MGRALPKRFFGNVNTNDSGDNRNTFNNATGEGIGGDSVASVTITNEGTYTSGLPTATFSAPDLAGVGGVRATGIVHGHALSAATTANGSGYNFGDTLTVVGGTSTSAATFTVASTLVVSAVKSNGGSGYNDGDLLTFSTGFSPSLILRVNRPGGGTGTPDNFTINQAGRRTSANPTNPVAYDSRTGTGTGCTVTLTFGVYSFSTVAVQGDYTVMPSNPASFTGGSGTGAAATVTFGVSGVEITDLGSGYTTVADALPAFSSGTAAGTSVLTVDTNNSTYVRDAFDTILAYAYITNNNLLGDIVKQQSTRQYKMKTSEGTAKCVLKAGTPSAVGEMSITATDSSGKTYYVTKLTRHLATLTQYGPSGWQFATGTRAQWVLDTAVNGVSVKLQNA